MLHFSTHQFNRHIILPTAEYFMKHCLYLEELKLIFDTGADLGSRFAQNFGAPTDTNSCEIILYPTRNTCLFIKEICKYFYCFKRF